MRSEDCKRGARAVLALGEKHTLTGAEVTVVRLTFTGTVVVALVKERGLYGTNERLHVHPYELREVQP